MVDYEIHSVPLSMPLWRRKVERFLEANQLRLDEVDYYAIITEPDGDEILAGGGLQGDIIKCIAVSETRRDDHLSNKLISHLISEAAQRGHHSVKVFTKPQNRQVFESLGFRLIGEAPLAILMENGQGIEKYKKYLQNISLASRPLPLAPKTGIIVMNANPFTLGHRYLIEQAAQQVDRLFVIPVKEDRSLFSYAERKAMIIQGVQEFRSERSVDTSLAPRPSSLTPNIIVCEGCDYAISAATFPTYFLKQLSDAADTQMLLDIDIFCRHIAPALGAKTRFVGSEPTDELTHRYNELLKQELPQHCLQLIEIPRFEKTTRSLSSSLCCDSVATTTPVSATIVRKVLNKGCFAEAAALVPLTTLPYLLAHLATSALQQELDTTPKPGLIDLHDNGAHTDMDYQLMQRSIGALRPYFVQLAQVAQQGNTDYRTISSIGIEAERAMLAATNGVNTHRGALFSLGLAIVAKTIQNDGEPLQSIIAHLAEQFPNTHGTHGSKAVSLYQAKGALAIAREGYQQLFTDWLPFYKAEKNSVKTLLLIMSQLDDTNILHRCGPEVAQRVKKEAANMLTDFSIEKVEAMNSRYIAENISPGGSADMLALTIFIASCVPWGSEK